MISTTALRYFAEVVRSGSFRAAADSLYVAPSAISRQIAALEEDLGAPLLERGRGRTTLRLTAAGELLMQFVQTVGNEIDRVRSDIEALKQLRRGQIRFGAPETFARDFIPDFLASFNQRYPGITYQVQVHGTPRLVEMVADDELEASLAFNPPPVTDVRHIYERLLPTRVLVSAGHPLCEREWVKLSDCADYGLALPDASIGSKRDYDEMFARAKIRPRAVLVSNSYELLRSAATAGLAVSLVNEELTYKREAPLGYRYVPLKDSRVKPQRLTLCVRRGRNLPVSTLAFIDNLVETLKQLEQE
ncbi:hypothetical protein CDO44_08825 [Pigmentiphaga sp. NML080357]|uniref:LysR family transcriptional regulator n=1 Tax=Pigmentiphaga sp. NML080357 TaxID=2008675 RepID=UPI000B411B1E|nr:LysR family transcriptional regulator [Pigmentiphaga sp. NML080357]OVZ60810.1 hypothetical protein CDO44_08825 [Pigmentiphaga sp. NML080357]